MSYIPLLSENEMQYICSVIPQKHVSNYFRQNPKEFAKICPGFRPTAIFRLNVGDLLFKNRNNGFVSSFIEKNIRIWLRQIQEHLDQCMEEGSSKDTAYIQTLSQSFFVDNIALYLKLIEEEHPEAYISLLSSAVKYANKVTNEQKKLNADAQSKDADIERLQSEKESVKDSLENAKAKQREYIAEINSLKQELTNIDELTALIHRKEEAIADLKAEVHVLKKSEEELKVELAEARGNQKQLEIQIRAELEKQQTEKTKIQVAGLKPLHPIDMDEFKEYLGYNLKDIGVTTPSDCLSLLKQHLCDTLFQGMPIIINRGTGVPLMKCIANTLVGKANVASLTYNKDISAQEIGAFLSENVRVVCLDGFLGNYSETELLALLEQHKNKITFLTLAYDRTLRFIPYEIFRYCHYLNLNRIQTLSVINNLTEDPSVFEETEANIPKANPDTRYSPLFKEILNEFGFTQSLTTHKCAQICNEQNLCSMLAFDVLPYCADVMQISPFAVSERLVKYAGDRGRCSYKKLLKEWFV